MTETFTEDAFLNIPSPIIIDILNRLPPKTAVQCCCVRKAWLKLLSEDEFVNMHLSKSPTCLLVHNASPRLPDSPLFGLVEVEDETNHHSFQPTAQVENQFRWSRPCLGLSMIGSINGLVCIDVFSIEGHSIHVWNPIMGEYASIPRPERQQQCNYMVTYGFGISSGKYKLVTIMEEIEVTKIEINNQDFVINKPRVLKSTCHVYTIGGAGSWKNIGPPPYLHIPYRRLKEGLFLNGNIHWLINDDDEPEQICCLNLDTELFPPFPHLPELGRRALATLNRYHGRLSVCYNSPCLDIVIWVMKDYGKHNSWSKEVVISKHLIHVRSYYDDIHIIKVFKDGEILLLRDFMLLSYHPQRRTLQVVDVKETLTGPSNEDINTRPFFYTKEYVPSIVSLKNLGEVNINRM